MTDFSFDLAIIICSGISFLIFFILQVIVFRMVHPEAVLRWIMNIFMIVSIVHLSALAIVYHYLLLDYPGGVLLMAGVSYFIFGLLAFVFRLSSRREMNRELTGAVVNKNLKKIFPELDSIPHADTLARMLEHINLKKIVVFVLCERSAPGTGRGQ